MAGVTWIGSIVLCKIGVRTLESAVCSGCSRPALSVGAGPLLLSAPIRRRRPFDIDPTPRVDPPPLLHSKPVHFQRLGWSLHFLSGRSLRANQDIRALHGIIFLCFTQPVVFEARPDPCPFFFFFQNNYTYPTRARIFLTMPNKNCFQIFYLLIWTV